MGLGFALIFFLLTLFAHNTIPSDNWSRRFTTLLGGNLPGGLIQFFTYIIFFFGVVRIIFFNKEIKQQTYSFSLRLLPETEQFVLNPLEVNELKLRTIQKEQERGRFLLTELIKKACTKFRSNKSTSEALEIVTNQVRINLSMDETQQSMIRYASWAIPSVGFVGTIVGIAQSLGYVTAGMTDNDIVKVTSALNVAFDTTLVSLVLSLILMYLYHALQENTEKLHLRMEEYVIENLINRIYKG